MVKPSLFDEETSPFVRKSLRSNRRSSTKKRLHSFAKAYGQTVAPRRRNVSIRSQKPKIKPSLLDEETSPFVRKSLWSNRRSSTKKRLHSFAKAYGQTVAPRRRSASIRSQKSLVMTGIEDRVIPHFAIFHISYSIFHIPYSVFDPQSW